jgi:hypothetical protein
MGHVNVGEFIVRNDGTAPHTHTHTDHDLFSIFHTIIVIKNVFLYSQPLAELNYKHKMDQVVMLKSFVD